MKEVVIFGDSLSDEGTFGFRFTTQPGHTWAHEVAVHLGCTAEPAVVCNWADAYLGRTEASRSGSGLNFAQGGARVNLPYSAVSEEPWGVPWSVARQLDAFLQAHRRFSPGQLVCVFAGTNDVTYRYDPAIDPTVAAGLRADIVVGEQTMAVERRRIRRAATDLAALIRQMRRAHAERVLVLGLYELGATPWFTTVAAQTYVDDLTRVFNRHLADELAKVNDDKVAFVNTAAHFAEILDDPESHGFTFGRGSDACAVNGADAVDFCDPATQRHPTAHLDHVFAASVHLSTAGHQALARHVIGSYL
ncbi:SGNH/GDSL hydrolase family protein [Mycobacterium sp. NAZ190054]|uniref:SGNH/GDSL hydrolase family protein n=1 Tax=Mycobacterium sp. NAZ190054 TaxID=1747766 RepID=UPI00079CA6A5|nr:SGNH/GDSL hydrolase family protein [Mycobacterium sp. NAZ190054]KWX64518.1 hypothetical protein ASJ79_08095 [Mycobacterium sp. NAZ190054]